VTRPAPRTWPRTRSCARCAGRVDSSRAGPSLVLVAGEAPLEVTLAPAGDLFVEVEVPPTADLFQVDRFRALLASQYATGAFTLERLDPDSSAWGRVDATLSVIGGEPGRLDLCFTRVPEGTLRVVASGQGALANDVSPATPIVAGRTSPPVRMRLVGVREVRVQVIDETGAPLSARLRRDVGGGGSVHWSADEHGRARVHAHPARTDTLLLEKDGHASVEVQLVPGVDDLRVVLPRAR
jgi:hypothetical protein